ncbi:MAG: hypothetical protein EHM28_00705 [Spirochaetaceae bacterium]|nr:MAG: hypothetical protein EHM28_00705 [Spirochaetaceae bacterium]
MTILINEEKIDFTLENEKTFTDVLSSVETWLNKAGMTTTRIKWNSSYIFPKDLSAVGGTPVSSIGMLEFSASPVTLKRSEELASLLDYLVKLKNAIIKFDKKILSELLPQFPDAEETLAAYLPDLAIEGKDNITEQLSRLLEGSTPEMIGLLKEKEKTTLESALSDAIGILGAVSSCLKANNGVLSSVSIDELEPVVARLGDVPVLLQTGKDSQAMEAIAKFSEMAQAFLDKAGNMFSTNPKGFSIDGKPFDEYSRSLNELLRELVGAFEKKDYILIGDLCEYEIQPRITKIIDKVKGSLSA